MRHFKWLTPFIFLIGFLLLLSACGGSLQKPTGLEDNREEQAENMKAAEANDKKRAQERTEEQASNEDKQSKDKNKEAATKTEDKNLDAQTSTSDKEVTDKKDTFKKTDQGSSNKKDDSTGKKEDKKESKKEQTTTNQDTKNQQSSSKTNKDSKDKKSNSEPKKEKKQTEQKKPNPEPPKEKEEAPPKKETPKEPKNKVTFSIKVSSSEVILSPITIEIEDGETVLQTLSQITKEKGIQRTILSSGYVSHIGNVGEKERGPESGWMYSVNGTFPNIGAAGYTLKNGDVVEWLYTLDLGKDLGAH